MAVILYPSQEKESGERLLGIIKAAIPDHPIEVFYSIGELSERLHRPFPDVSIAILYAASRGELMELIYLGDILGELRVVLALPDSQPEILEKAHILRPRFIAAAESDFKHLVVVLKRMMELHVRMR